MQSPMLDVRHFRLKKLITPQYSHLLWLLFWPTFMVVFTLLERFYHPSVWHPMECAWDAAIPFCEWFVFPYLFWFLYVGGMIAFTAFYDPPAMRKLMRYITVTYAIALLVYFLYPNCQQLRPAEFLRENLLTAFMARFYRFDTNTNVCPSLHVIGSVAVLVSAWDQPRFRALPWRIAFLAVTALICASTVFLKQHSLVDVLAALPVCALAIPLCYRKKAIKNPA